MILLVPVLDFVASEIPVPHRLLKCWATQIQSTRAVSITPTTTRSISHPQFPSPAQFPFLLPLTVAFSIPHAPVLLSAAQPAHRCRQGGRALAVDPFVRRLSPRAACDSKKFVSLTTPGTCEKGRVSSLVGLLRSSNT